MIAIVKSSFLRRSGVLNARPKAVSTGPPGVQPGWWPRRQRSVTRYLSTPEGPASRAERPYAAGPVPDGTREPALRHTVIWRGQAVVADPPAASIFSLALAEKACAVTFTATPISPVPSTFTSFPPRTAPLVTRSSTVTSPPEG